MRRAMIIVPALLLAACDNAGEWESQQAELANELNATAPAADQPVALETDAAEPPANDANAAATVTDNEATPPPATQE